MICFEKCVLYVSELFLENGDFLKMLELFFIFYFGGLFDNIRMFECFLSLKHFVLFLLLLLLIIVLFC